MGLKALSLVVVVVSAVAAAGCLSVCFAVACVIVWSVDCLLYD